MTPKGIAVVGSMLEDHKRFRIGELGGVPVWHRVRSHGGIGRNVCENLARLGADVAFVGLTEPGPRGAEFEDRLRSCGAELLVRPVERAIGNFDAEIDESGELGPFTFRLPAAGALDWGVVSAAAGWLADARLVVVETGLPEDMLWRLRRWTARHGVALCGLPTRMREWGPRWPLLASLDMVVLNHAEAAAVLDRPGSDALDAAAELTDRGIGSVVVTAGAAGVVTAERGGDRRDYPATPVECVDTTGAGDAFVAGLACGLAQDLGLPAAVRLGLAVSEVTIRCRHSTCRAVSPSTVGHRRPSRTGVA